MLSSWWWCRQAPSFWCLACHFLAWLSFLSLLGLPATCLGRSAALAGPETLILGNYSVHEGLVPEPSGANGAVYGYVREHHAPEQAPPTDGRVSASGRRGDAFAGASLLQPAAGAGGDPSRGAPHAAATKDRMATIEKDGSAHSGSILSPPGDHHAPGPPFVEPGALDFGEQALCSPVQRRLLIKNSSPHAELQLLTLTYDGLDFSTSGFRPQSVAPRGQLSLLVSFLPRVLGPVRGALTIQSSGAPVSVQLRGCGIPSPFRVQPLLGFRALVGSKFGYSISLYNPFPDALKVKEVYTNEDFLRLSLPLAGSSSSSSSSSSSGSGGSVGPSAPESAAPGERDSLLAAAGMAARGPQGPLGLWDVAAQESKVVIQLEFGASNPGRYAGLVHIKAVLGGAGAGAGAGGGGLLAATSLVVPVEITAMRPGGTLYRNPEEVDFGTLTGAREQRVATVALLNAGDTPVTLTLPPLSGDPNLVGVALRADPLVLLPGTETEALVLTYAGGAEGVAADGWVRSGRVPVLAWEAGADSPTVLEVPFRARVLHGALALRRGRGAAAAAEGGGGKPLPPAPPLAAAQRVPGDPPAAACRGLAGTHSPHCAQLCNHFPVPLAVYTVTLEGGLAAAAAAGDGAAEPAAGVPAVLGPGACGALQLPRLAGRGCTRVRVRVRVATNLTELWVPLRRRRRGLLGGGRGSGGGGAGGRGWACPRPLPWGLGRQKCAPKGTASMPREPGRGLIAVSAQAAPFAERGAGAAQGAAGAGRHTLNATRGGSAADAPLAKLANSSWLLAWPPPAGRTSEAPAPAEPPLPLASWQQSLSLSLSLQLRGRLVPRGAAGPWAVVGGAGAAAGAGALVWLLLRRRGGKELQADTPRGGRGRGGKAWARGGAQEEGSPGRVSPRARERAASVEVRREEGGGRKGEGGGGAAGRTAKGGEASARSKQPRAPLGSAASRVRTPRAPPPPLKSSLEAWADGPEESRLPAGVHAEPPGPEWEERPRRRKRAPAPVAVAGAEAGGTALPTSAEAGTGAGAGAGLARRLSAAPTDGGAASPKGAPAARGRAEPPPASQARRPGSALWQPAVAPMTPSTAPPPPPPTSKGPSPFPLSPPPANGPPSPAPPPEPFRRPVPLLDRRYPSFMDMDSDVVLDVKSPRPPAPSAPAPPPPPSAPAPVPAPLTYDIWGHHFGELQQPSSLAAFAASGSDSPRLPTARLGNDSLFASSPFGSAGVAKSDSPRAAGAQGVGDSAGRGSKASLLSGCPLAALQPMAPPLSPRLPAPSPAPARLGEAPGVGRPMHMGGSARDAVLPSSYMHLPQPVKPAPQAAHTLPLLPPIRALYPHVPRSLHEFTPLTPPPGPGRVDLGLGPFSPTWGSSYGQHGLVMPGPGLLPTPMNNTPRWHFASTPYVTGRRDVGIHAGLVGTPRALARATHLGCDDIS